MDKESLVFQRGNKEKVTFPQTIDIIAEFIMKDLSASYEITVGTDSQSADHTKMVEVIAVHRVGDGGIFFYRIEHMNVISNLKQKITIETGKSLELADGLLDDLEFELAKNDIDMDLIDLSFQIHCDIGRCGKTKALIKEITSWVTSCGYNCSIKPDSYCASGIANKYSKFHK